MKGILIIPLVLAVFVSITSAQKAAPKGPSEANFFGEISNGQYTNKYFGFSIRLPEGFPTMTSEQIALLTKAGADMMKSDSGAGATKIDAAMLTQATLMAVSEKPLGQPENAFLEIPVQKQKTVGTANMALAASVILATSGGKARLVKNVERKIGKRVLPGAVLELNVGIKLTQELYVVMIKGYSVAFGITYSTAAGRDKMLSILDSLEFSK